MMSDNLFDMLEYTALGTEWREWLKEVEKAADLVDLRRADTWTVLKQPAKNVHAVRWLTGELRKAATAPSPDDRTWCVLYLLAAHCRDNTVLGYVADTFVGFYRTQHRAGTLFCMEVVGRMTLHDEYPHLNALYNLMMGLALREWRRLLEGDEDYPCFLTEADFRRVERSLPDFRCGGFKEMVRLMTGNRPVGALTAGELAARCHQSETVFRERFKEEFGRPVAEWLRERRKEDILAMLSDTGTPLSDVAARNGFQSLSTLSDYCHRNFGKSPSQMRRDAAG
ncbi:helix-turn-helix transcriptional regulator [Bacteroides gallinaceum]|uniref:helix-turn-helix transcriptional regulator n=1 Tax=Bacteroides gallinaceum TaxID=1462571 RepID=UPI0025A4852A|nr:helix-turn-helix transcriptional regulator [Bacteroides gallinaceum]MDM8153803.1 helix-turn-helix transcriptional regulator [Bacteroides gallinaceum]